MKEMNWFSRIFFLRVFSKFKYIIRQEKENTRLFQFWLIYGLYPIPITSLLSSDGDPHLLHADPVRIQVNKINKLISTHLFKVERKKILIST